MSCSRISVRHSIPDDIAGITEIYADEVLHGLASFEVEPPDSKEIAARREKVVDAGYPWLVAMVDDQLAGYAYAAPYRTRPAYQYTVENSVYVCKDRRGTGIGKLLMKELIAECKRGPWRTMIAIIGDANNIRSIATHKSLGFRYVGTIECAGYKLNQWVDSVIMQRDLHVPGDTTPT